LELAGRVILKLAVLIVCAEMVILFPKWGKQGPLNTVHVILTADGHKEILYLK